MKGGKTAVTSIVSDLPHVHDWDYFWLVWLHTSVILLIAYQQPVLSMLAWFCSTRKKKKGGGSISWKWGDIAAGKHEPVCIFAGTVNVPSWLTYFLKMPMCRIFQEKLLTRWVMYETAKKCFVIRKKAEPPLSQKRIFSVITDICIVAKNIPTYQPDVLLTIQLCH